MEFILIRKLIVINNLLLFKGFIKIKRDMPYDIPPHYDLKLMSNQQVKY